MKTALKILGGIVVCLVVLLVIFRITGLDPNGGRPGLWLKGNVVTAPVADWSFTETIPYIKIQTESWYGLPHSVTINCMIANGQLYLVSPVPAGQHRSWDDNVMRDPHVLLKIGNNLYDRTLTVVTDPAERESVLQARKKKYPELKIPPTATVNIFHVVG
jgi:hypothetical protein